MNFQPNFRDHLQEKIDDVLLDDGSHEATNFPRNNVYLDSQSCLVGTMLGFIILKL